MIEYLELYAPNALTLIDTCFAANKYFPYHLERLVTLAQTSPSASIFIPQIVLDELDNLSHTNSPDSSFAASARSFIQMYIEKKQIVTVATTGYANADQYFMSFIASNIHRTNILFLSKDGHLIQSLLKSDFGANIRGAKKFAVLQMDGKGLLRRVELENSDTTQEHPDYFISLPWGRTALSSYAMNGTGETPKQGDTYYTDRLERIVLSTLRDSSCPTLWHTNHPDQLAVLPQQMTTGTVIKLQRLVKLQRLLQLATDLPFLLPHCYLVNSNNQVVGYLMSEPKEGEYLSLKRFADELFALSEKQKLRVCTQICYVVESAHRMGLGFGGCINPEDIWVERKTLKVKLVGLHEMQMGDLAAEPRFVGLGCLPNGLLPAQSDVSAIAKLFTQLFTGGSSDGSRLCLPLPQKELLQQVAENGSTVSLRTLRNSLQEQLYHKAAIRRLCENPTCRHAGILLESKMMNGALCLECANLPEAKERICRECGTGFRLALGEKQFYAKNNLQEPTRCKSCRAKRASQRTATSRTLPDWGMPAPTPKEKTAPTPIDTTAFL